MEFLSALRDSLGKGQFWADKMDAWIKGHLADLVIAVIMFVVGLYALRVVHNTLLAILERRHYEASAINFILKIVHVLLLIGLVLLCFDQAGIPTTSFVAAFGAFGIAIGLALQNNMSNFASGLLILMMQPLKVGDWVRINDKEGSVKKIDFMYTEIATKDNRTIFIPNSLITSQSVINFSHNEERYIEFFFDIGYNNDHHKAIEVLKDVFKAEKRVLNADRMEIGVYEFADNSVRIRALPLVKWSHYTAARYSIMSHVKDAFDANGIDIPYPQRVVYMVNQEGPAPQTEPTTDAQDTGVDK